MSDIVPWEPLRPARYTETVEDRPRARLRMRTRTVTVTETEVEEPAGWHIHRHSDTEYVLRNGAEGVAILYLNPNDHEVHRIRHHQLRITIWIDGTTRQALDHLWLMRHA